MSLSRNEMNTIKKAIKESIQAYVDIKIANAQYAFTEIATVTKENWDDLSNDIEVKGKATYTHVISVGKIVYPVGSVVYCFIPNNQYNNMFILGKLDKVPAQITGGTIGIGRIGTTEPPQYNFYVDSDGNVTITKGSINLGKNGNSYNFSVDNNGNVSMSKGSINLGNGNFVVDNQGNVTINQGSIHLGWNGSDYNFSVENDGEMTAYNGHFIGSVTALSGEIGKFKISVTDGLLEYEDPATNSYVYLGKNVSNGCGLVVSEVPFGQIGQKVSIAPQGFQAISDDGNYISTLTANVLIFENLGANGTTTIAYDGVTLEQGANITIRSGNIDMRYGDIIIQNGDIKFSNASRLTGLETYEFISSDTGNYIGNNSPSMKKVLTEKAMALSIPQLKKYIDKQDGITVELSGDITLSTSSTSANFLSNSTGGKHTVSYGHSLSLPASGHTSDVRLKEQISEMPNIEDLYNQIKLYKFKYHSDIVDADDRFHWGIIAQEVDELFKSNGYTDKDFSLVYKSKQNVGYNEDKYVGDDKVFRVLSNEFNAMHVQMIQKLWKRCDALEKHCDTLEKEIEQLKQERNDK